MEQYQFNLVYYCRELYTKPQSLHPQRNRQPSERLSYYAPVESIQCQLIPVITAAPSPIPPFSNVLYLMNMVSTLFSSFLPSTVPSGILLQTSFTSSSMVLFLAFSATTCIELSEGCIITVRLTHVLSHSDCLIIHGTQHSGS